MLFLQDKVEKPGKRPRVKKEDSVSSTFPAYNDKVVSEMTIWAGVVVRSRERTFFMAKTPRH